MAAECWFPKRNGIPSSRRVHVQSTSTFVKESSIHVQEDGFLLFAHELVHVLQCQEEGCGLGLFHRFVIKYLLCLIANVSSGWNNPIEREAYDFANGPRDPPDPRGELRKCIEA